MITARHIKTAGGFVALGLVAPVDAIISPVSLWAANIQKFTKYGQGLNLAGLGVTKIDVPTIVNFSYLGGAIGSAVAIDLSGNNLPSVEIESLLNGFAAMGSNYPLTIDLSGGYNARPIPTSEKIPLVFSITGNGADPVGIDGVININNADGVSPSLVVYYFLSTDSVDEIIAGILNQISSSGYSGISIVDGVVTVTDDALLNVNITGDAIGIGLNVTQPGALFEKSPYVLFLEGVGVGVTTN